MSANTRVVTSVWDVKFISYKVSNFVLYWTKNKTSNQSVDRLTKVWVKYGLKYWWIWLNNHTLSLMAKNWFNKSVKTTVVGLNSTRENVGKANDLVAMWSYWIQAKKQHKKPNLIVTYEHFQKSLIFLKNYILE